MIQEVDITPFEKNQIISMTKFCLSQDFFTFNDRIYKQEEGLSMGSPVSPLMADIFMDHLENNHILTPKNPVFHHIKFYRRYVDDCLLILEVEEANPTNTTNRLLEFVNKVHKNIKFTIEIEEHATINFLDLTLRREDNNISYNIYRKPTQTDNVIPMSSNHPMQHKLASFRCYTRRALKIPMKKQDLLTELNIIKQIAQENGYPTKIVDNFHNKWGEKEELPIQGALTKFTSLPFIGPLSYKIQNILKANLPIRIAFKTHKTLGKLLTYNKDKVEHKNKSGVYQLSCSTAGCKTIYVGQTTRNLETRIKEHKNYPHKSNFGHHLTFNKHIFNISMFLWQDITPFTSGRHPSKPPGRIGNQQGKKKQKSGPM